MTDPTPSPDPVPPVPDVVPPDFQQVKDVLLAFLSATLQTGALKDELAKFIDDRLHTAITDAVAQLTADESTLMLPLTAWANGWATQLRTDYSPGGVLEKTLKNAAHSVKIFMPDPSSDDGYKVVFAEDAPEEEDHE